MVSAFKQALHPVRRFTALTWGENFVARDKKVLKAQVFEPRVEPRDTIVFFHGIAAAPSGTEAYKILMHYLNREGFRVIAVDQRGHGRTGGQFDIEKMQTDVVDILKSLREKGITIRRGRFLRKKVGTQKLSSVQIAAHSMGSVIAAAGLLKAHKENAAIPKVSGFFAYAPPQEMKDLAIIQDIGANVEKLKGYPRRVANLIASVVYPMKTDRFKGPAKIGAAVLGGAKSLLTGKAHADQLRLHTVSQFMEEVNKVPNFVSVLADLQHNQASPEFSLVWLGTKDSDTETRNSEKRRRYTMHLKVRGVHVKAIPFTHHPTLNPASRFNIFRFSERIAKDVAALPAAAQRAERISRTSLMPPEPRKE